MATYVRVTMVGESDAHVSYRVETAAQGYTKLLRIDKGNVETPIVGDLSDPDIQRALALAVGAHRKLGHWPQNRVKQS